MRPRVAPPAAVITFAYLVATLPLFWRTTLSTRDTIFAAAHVAAIACLWWVMRARGARPLADWLPLMLVPLLYAELPSLMGEPVYADPLVRAWESALFGTQPAQTLAGSAPSVLLSELLHLGYLLYYPIVYVPPLMLYLAGRSEELRRTVLAVMLTYALCFLVFVFFPVEGPRYAWDPPPGIPRGPLRSLAVTILEWGSARGTAFPSSHAAVAVAQAVLALRYQRSLGVAVAVVALLLMLGAVYGGFHYAVDLLAGAVLGAIVALAVIRAFPLPSRGRETGHT
jgi:membrane-associated phospholipid phosphatase